MEIVQAGMQSLQPLDRQEHVSFHISTLNKHTKPKSHQNSIPLISQPTSQTRKQPDNPQSKTKGKQESTPSTAESKQGRGETYISQSRSGTQGLAKVNNSTSRPIIDGTVPFHTVNRCQTVVEPSHQITKDLQHPRITEECHALILHHLVLDSL